jgi:hypothetical protein
MAQRGRPPISWSGKLGYEFREDRVDVRVYYDRYLKEKGHPKRCEVEQCPLHKANGFDETLEWCGKPIVLELDHIDGNFNNNSSDNIRYLCPNCHSQTETSSGRNVDRIIDKTKSGYGVRDPELNRINFKYLNPRIIIPDSSIIAYPKVKKQLEAELSNDDLTPERRMELKSALTFLKKLMKKRR